MNKFKLIAVAALLSLAAMACSLGGAAQQAASAAVNAATGGNGGSASVSGELWSDVPRMDGLQGSDIEMPLVTQMFMQTMMNQEVENGQFHVAIFSTDSPVADVQAFYTAERMGQAGWNAGEEASSCFSGDQEAAAGMGMFCLYGREDGDTQIALMIMASADEEQGNTDVFFVRVEESATPEP